MGEGRPWYGSRPPCRYLVIVVPGFGGASPSQPTNHMFDDDSTWDGLSGLGSFAMLAGWGLTGWLCIGFGNQQGLDAAQKCMAEPGCTIQAQKGFLGIEYLAVVHATPAAASGPAAP